MKLLSRSAARALDAELMSPAFGYNLSQLMELAGLSVACAIAATYPAGSRVLAVCGPGNNGGDGLVAARHLKFFGYEPAVLYPKRPDREPFAGLVTQLETMRVPMLSEFPQNDGDGGFDFDVILDGVFGFSFDSSRPVRAPFDEILNQIVAAAATVPVASIDIPSGWDVERGPLSQNNDALHPHMLISLTAPKQCAQFFAGAHHFVGGRFLPPSLGQKYGIGDFSYVGSEQCVRVSALASSEEDARKEQCE